MPTPLRHPVGPCAARFPHPPSMVRARGAASVSAPLVSRSGWYQRFLPDMDRETPMITRGGPGGPGGPGTWQKSPSCACAYVPARGAPVSAVPTWYLDHPDRHGKKQPPQAFVVLPWYRGTRTMAEEAGTNGPLEQIARQVWCQNNHRPLDELLPALQRGRVCSHGPARFRCTLERAGCEQGSVGRATCAHASTCGVQSTKWCGRLSQRSHPRGLGPREWGTGMAYVGVDAAGRAVDRPGGLPGPMSGIGEATPPGQVLNSTLFAWPSPERPCPQPLAWQGFLRVLPPTPTPSGCCEPRRTAAFISATWAENRKREQRCVKSVTELESGVTEVCCG